MERPRYDGLDAFRSISTFGVVFIHFFLAISPPESPLLELLIRVRDCAFPIIVLTSFFVMTRSLMASPGGGFGQFVTQRFWRLEVPCLLWSALYWLIWGVAGPLWAGRTVVRPPATLWLSGWGHLWFLQFLFVGAVLAFPLVRGISRRPQRRWTFVAVLVAASAAYWMWGRPTLESHVAMGWLDGFDLNLEIGIRQSIRYAMYILLGTATALAADVIDTWYRSPAIQAMAILAAAGAFMLHVTAMAPAVTRALYTMTVFVLLLGPWSGRIFDWLRRAAKYSYSIYIIHPAVVPLVAAAFALARVAPAVPGLLAGSVVVFALSGAAAALLRPLVPADWFLPLIHVRAGNGRAVPYGRVAETPES